MWIVSHTRGIPTLLLVLHRRYFARIDSDHTRSIPTLLLVFYHRYFARIDSVVVEGDCVDSKWKLSGFVSVKRPYKMEERAKLETIKSGPYKWTAGKEGHISFQAVVGLEIIGNRK